MDKGFLENDISELQDFKEDLLNLIQVGADVDGNFSESIFFDNISEALCEAGQYDDIQRDTYINSRKGIKIDGYNWNQTERILSAVITKFSNEKELTTINKGEIEKLGMQASRFISNMNNQKFKETLDSSDPALELAEEMSSYLIDQGMDGEEGFRPAAVKFRVIILTDLLLSERLNLGKLKIENIHDKEAYFEIWDLKRIRDLTLSGQESEPCDVDFSELCIEGGLSTLRANISQSASDSGVTSYICVIPGTVLRDLFANFGQRLLESNVRTFLQFRGNVNKGMKETLLQNPENFFAYNNGITVTASNIELEEKSGRLLIKKLGNMQIVNGGQTTSAIYFSPLSKGTQQGVDFRNIDLSKVFVQMKLAVVEDENKADEIKENVAKYANLQNVVQPSDFASKHPIHRAIEKQSRTVWAPPSQIQPIPTKWFYERTRGQYQTSILAIKTSSRVNQFKAENPKEQMFTKLDMGKFENTWRMKPWEVAVGGQDHLGKKIGPVLQKEWNENSDNFGIMFFKDIVAKAILFRTTDSSIQSSEWYKAQIGLKAQTIIYTISFLRYKLKESGHDINLKRIYDSQKLSDTLLRQILELAPVVRKKLTDLCFANGNTNPAMYAKKLDAWTELSKISYEMTCISKDDLISKSQAKERKEADAELNSENAEIDFVKLCTDISDEKWLELYEYLKQYIPKESPKMRTLERFTKLSDPQMLKKISYPFDYKTAIELRNKALEIGFMFLD